MNQPATHRDTLAYRVAFGPVTGRPDLADVDLTHIIDVDPAPLQVMAAQVSKEITAHLATTVHTFLEVWFFPDGDIPLGGTMHGATGSILDGVGKLRARFTVSALLDLSHATRRATAHIHAGWYVQAADGDHLRRVSSVRYEGGPAGTVRSMGLALSGGTERLVRKPGDRLLSRSPQDHQCHLAHLAAARSTKSGC